MGTAPKRRLWRMKRGSCRGSGTIGGPLRGPGIVSPRRCCCNHSPPVGRHPLPTRKGGHFPAPLGRVVPVPARRRTNSIARRWRATIPAPLGRVVPVPRRGAPPLFPILHGLFHPVQKLPPEVRLPAGASWFFGEIGENQKKSSIKLSGLSAAWFQTSKKTARRM